MSETPKYLDKAGLAYVWSKINSSFVRAEEGLQLSENNYSDADKAKLDGMFNVGVFARNIGQLEGEHAQILEREAAIQELLEAAGYRLIAKPNLIANQPEGVTLAVPSSAVIEETFTIPAETAEDIGTALTYTVTNEAITTGYKLHWLASRDWSIVKPGTVTAVFAAGSMTLTVPARTAAHDAMDFTVFLCTQQSAVLPYGDVSRHYEYNRPVLDSFGNARYTGDEQDQISERIVTLTGSDIVDEADGTSYTKAVQFTVANAPASGYNNSDMMVFNYGSSSYRADRDYNARNLGEIEAMTVGETYTLSCWARVISGENGARVRMAWGCKGVSGSAYNGGEKYFDITNTEWQRITWTFVFSPTGEQWYTFTSNDDVTYRASNWGKKVAVGVCRWKDCVVQLCGFRLTAGGLWGTNDIDTLTAEVAAARAEVAQLQSTIASAQAINARLAAAEAAITALQEASAKTEMVQAQLMAGDGFIVQAVFDSGSAEMGTWISAHKESGAAFAERITDAQTGKVTYRIWRYRVTPDAWWEWPDEYWDNGGTTD